MVYNSHCHLCPPHSYFYESHKRLKANPLPSLFDCDRLGCDIRLLKQSLIAWRIDWPNVDSVQTATWPTKWCELNLEVPNSNLRSLLSKDTARKGTWTNRTVILGPRGLPTDVFPFAKSDVSVCSLQMLAARASSRSGCLSYQCPDKLPQADKHMGGFTKSCIETFFLSFRVSCLKRPVVDSCLGAEIAPRAWPHRYSKAIYICICMYFYFLLWISLQPAERGG